MQSALHEQELPRTHQSPWLARRALGDWYGAALQPDELHLAKLLTSELVTNAVLHGRGRIVLAAGLSDGRLRVQVTDEGPGFAYRGAHRGLDQQRRFDRPLGRGLAIVEAESARWGIGQGTTQVWFELTVSSPAETLAGGSGVSGRQRPVL